MTENFEIPEEELLEFLNSMEDEDQDNEATDDASAEVLIDQREYNRLASAASRQRAKERKLEIQRKAFEQKLIDLNMVIPNHNAQLLIQELMSKYDTLIAHNKAYVHKRLNDLMRARTPQFLRAAWKRAPQAFKRHPGFMYKTDKIYAKEYEIWVVIDGPYYFEQGTESKMLHDKCARFVKGVDKAIYLINRYEAERKQVAVDSALKLAHLKRGTYFELLQAKPEWFQILYDAIESKKLKSAGTQTYVNDIW